MKQKILYNVKMWTDLGYEVMRVSETPPYLLLQAFIQPKCFLWCPIACFIVQICENLLNISRFNKSFIYWKM